MKTLNKLYLSAALLSGFSSLTYAQYSVEKTNFTKAEIEQIVENKIEELKEKESLVESAKSEIIELVLNTKNLYASTVSYKGLNNDILIKAGAIPKTMEVYEDKQRVLNHFKKDVIIEETILERDKKTSALKIVYAGVPKEVCKSLFIEIPELFLKVEVENKNGITLIYDISKDVQKNNQLISKEKIEEGCNSEENTLILKRT